MSLTVTKENYKEGNLTSSEILFEGMNFRVGIIPLHDFDKLTRPFGYVRYREIYPYSGNSNPEGNSLIHFYDKISQKFRDWRRTDYKPGFEIIQGRLDKARLYTVVRWHDDRGYTGVVVDNCNYRHDNSPGYHEHYKDEGLHTDYPKSDYQRDDFKEKDSRVWILPVTPDTYLKINWTDN